MLMSTFLSMHEHHPQQPFGDLDNSGVVELLLSSRQVQTFIPRSKVITHIQPKGGWEGFWGLRQGIEVWGVSTDQKKNILSLHISGYHHHCTLREGFPKKSSCSFEFVQITINLTPPPLPLIWTTCTPFFERQRAKKIGQGSSPPSPSPNHTW